MTAPIGYPEKFGTLLNAQRALGPKPELAQPKTELGQTIGPEKVVGPTFGEQLNQFVGSVDHMQKGAQTQAENFAVGRTNDIHGTMIETEQAEISLRLLANVRNRVVDLYREVMRMGS
jgi:flagellar hook-basal body complex protein FliE